MRRKTVSIQGHNYGKGEFEKKWSEVVGATECNYYVRGDDEAFIASVVEMVPKWKAIKDKGEVRYKIRNKKFQGRGVRGVVMITPNSKREVWLGKGQVVGALFPRATTVPTYVQNKRDALAAMRQIIDPQIKTFRMSVNRQLQRGKVLKCPMSGDFIEAAAFHIDHRYPFKNLVEEWCRSERVDLERIDVYCRGTKCYFRNTELAESWFDYHAINAQLQALSAEANLRKGAKYYG
jgi:hypothetical protein